MNKHFLINLELLLLILELLLSICIIVIFNILYNLLEEGREIIDNLVKDIYHLTVFDYTFIPCQTHKLKPFKLLFNGYWVEIPPEDYVLNVNNYSLNTL
jgi:hypothetical protein